MIADRLRQFNPRLGAADVCVVGCGPAGLALAAELASNGVHVALVGRHQDCLQVLPFMKPASKREGHIYKIKCCYIAEGAAYMYAISIRHKE